MSRTPDLVEIINSRRRKSYLAEALAFTCQEMAGCEDVEPEFSRMRRLSIEAEALMTSEDSPSQLEF